MANELTLRPFQLDAVEELRSGIRTGHKSQILVAPCGSGKTIVAAHLMDEARKKSSKVAFVVDRVALVDQSSAVLDNYGIDHGIIQAGNWRRRGYEPIQICSAQTLEKRGFFPEIKMLVVDEAHCVRKETAALIKSMPELTVIGLTATPFTKGLSELYKNVVNMATTNSLIEKDLLVPLKIYAAIAPDMNGAKVIAGEWSDRDIEKRGISIIGDIVQVWIEKTKLHFGGPAKTICFSATVDHGTELCRQFNAAGFRFEQISYKDTNDERRRELIAEFRKEDSDIVGLVSCEIFSKGFDCPSVAVGISARPYRKSFSSHIQQIGRIQRPSPGKSFGLWLDHSGNCLRFYADTQELFETGVKDLDDGELDGKVRKEPEEGIIKAIKCGACGFMLPPSAKSCPACGHVRPMRPNIDIKDGVMVMIGSKQIEASGKYSFLADRDIVWQQLAALALQRKHGDIESAQRFAQAQYRNLYGAFARRNIRNTSPEEPSYALSQMIQSNLIRWAKRKNKEVRQSA